MQDIRYLFFLSGAVQAFRLVSNEGLQMQGDIGMTDAHDAGFYLKRARPRRRLATRRSTAIATRRSRGVTVNRRLTGDKV